MESIVLTCPHCKKQIKAPASVAGRKVKCPACQAAFTAAGAPPPEAPAVIEMMSQPATAKPSTPFGQCQSCGGKVAMAALEEVDGKLLCAYCLAVAAPPLSAPEARAERDDSELTWKDPRVGAFCLGAMAIATAVAFFWVFSDVREDMSRMALGHAGDQSSYRLASGKTLSALVPDQAALAKLEDTAWWADKLGLHALGTALAGVGVMIWALVRTRRMWGLPVAGGSVAALLAIVVLWHQYGPIVSTYRLTDNETLTTQVIRDPSAREGFRITVSVFNPDIEAIKAAALRGDAGAIGRVLEAGDKKAKVRKAALAELKGMGMRAMPALSSMEKTLADKDDILSMESAFVISNLGPEAHRAAPALIAHMETEKLSEMQLVFLAEAAFKLDPAGGEAIPALTAMVSSKRQKAAAAAAWGLSKYGARAKTAAPALKATFRRVCEELMSIPAYGQYPMPGKMPPAWMMDDEKLLSAASNALIGSCSESECNELACEQLCLTMKARKGADRVPAASSGTAPKAAWQDQQDKYYAIGAVAGKIAHECIPQNRTNACAALLVEWLAPEDSRRETAAMALSFFSGVDGTHPDLREDRFAEMCSALTRMLTDKDPGARVAAAMTLLAFKRGGDTSGAAELLPVLAEAIQGQSLVTRRRAAQAIAKRYREQAREVLPVLYNLAGDDDPVVAGNAIEALEWYLSLSAEKGDPAPYLAAVQKANQSLEPDVRKHAAICLAIIARREETRQQELAKAKAEEAEKNTPTGRAREQAWTEVRQDLDELIVSAKLEKAKLDRLEGLLKGYLRRIFEKLPDGNRAMLSDPAFAMRVNVEAAALSSAVGAIVSKEFETEFQKWMRSDKNRNRDLFRPALPPRSPPNSPPPGANPR